MPTSKFTIGMFLVSLFLSGCTADLPAQPEPPAATITAPAPEATPEAPMPAPNPNPSPEITLPDTLPVDEWTAGRTWADTQESNLHNYWNVRNWSEACQGVWWACNVVTTKSREEGVLVVQLTGHFSDVETDVAGEHAVEEIMWAIGPADPTLTRVVAMDGMGNEFVYASRLILEG